MAPRQDTWQRAALQGVIATVIAGLLFGAVVAIAGVTFAGRSLDRAEANQNAAPERLVMPSYSPTPTQEDEQVSPLPPLPTPSGTPSATAEAQRFELTANPTQVAPGERIELSGVYPLGEDGADLQVQRMESGAWADFPVSTPVRSGAYRTEIYTSRTGEMQFRMFDTSTGKSSSVATVTVG